MLANVHMDLVSALEDWERIPFCQIIVCYCFEGDGYIPVMQHAIVGKVSHVDNIGWHTREGITSHHQINGDTFHHFIIEGRTLQELIDYARDDYHFFTLALNTHAVKN